jgi:hypothetical protein
VNQLESFYLRGIHYRQEMVKCGKPACKRCPHGPYWYAYSRRGAFLRKEYVGKELPANVKVLRRQCADPDFDEPSEVQS